MTTNLPYDTNMPALVNPYSDKLGNCLTGVVDSNGVERTFSKVTLKFNHPELDSTYQQRICADTTPLTTPNMVKQQCYSGNDGNATCNNVYALGGTIPKDQSNIVTNDNNENITGSVVAVQSADVFTLNIRDTPPPRTTSCPVYTVPSYGKWTRKGDGITTPIGTQVTDETDSWNCVPYSNVSEGNLTNVGAGAIGPMTSNVMLSFNKYGYNNNPIIRGTDDVNTKVIKATVTDCPTGTTLVNNQCIKPIICPTGQRLLGENCVSARQITCPEGQTLSGTNCVSSRPIICPTGFTLSGTNCLSSTPITCPEGQTLSGTNCVISAINTVCPRGVKNSFGECI